MSSHPRLIALLHSPWVLGLLGVLALMANIGFYIPEVPDVEGEIGFSIPGLDKIYHLSTFALTCWLLAQVLWTALPRPLVAAVALTTAHAAVIELVQSQLPQRAADAGDLLADLVGVALGAVVWLVTRKNAPRPHP